MKKKIIYTQRVAIVETYGERRDCTDQRVAKFLDRCGFLPIPIPNMVSIVEEFIETVEPDGIVLTGGNSLVRYGGDAPERDAVDEALLAAAMPRQIPLYGICRGMQSILAFFSVPLCEVQGHVAVRHALRGRIARESVNSYHKQGTSDVLPPLLALSRSMDGVVESVLWEKGRVKGVMWHPEREEPFQEEDLEEFKNFFKEGTKR